MIDLFNKKIGVDYPWEKYAQVMVDYFVAGGMENSSATTNTADSLRDPKLIPEYPTNTDDLISHELAHQWFGDLVTCKDWANIWLNEGFATFFETVWTESHYGKDQASYNLWKTERDWFASSGLYDKPIVRRNFDQSEEFDDNAYGKGGWVLYMLRHQLGDDAFWRSIKHYLEVNRGKNVVTPDLIKAIEETTHINVDRFFQQWIYSAGAPKFDLAYTYDAEKHQVALTVKQTQKVESNVGIFAAPVDVEITTASGPKLYTANVTKAAETFTFPSDSAPLMVLFDKGGYLLKSAKFHKEKKEWLYQLKHATEFSDRADAIVALEQNQKRRRSRRRSLHLSQLRSRRGASASISAQALGNIGGPSALKHLLASLDTNKEPAVRYHIVSSIGNFKDNADLPAKLQSIAAQRQFLSRARRRSRSSRPHKIRRRAPRSHRRRHQRLARRHPAHLRAPLARLPRQRQSRPAAHRLVKARQSRRLAQRRNRQPRAPRQTKQRDHAADRVLSQRALLQHSLVRDPRTRRARRRQRRPRARSPAQARRPQHRNDPRNQRPNRTPAATEASQKEKARSKRR